MNRVRIPPHLAFATIAFLFGQMIASGQVAADTAADCLQDTNLRLKFAACTEIIASQATDAEKAEAYHQRGRALLADDPVASVTDLRQAVRLAPEVAAIWIDLAEAAIRNDQIGAALAYLERAAMFALDDVNIPLKRADAYLRRNDEDKAAEELARAESLDPSNPEIPAQRARLALENEDLAAAHASFSRAAILDPENPRRHLDVGGTALLLFDLEQAETELRKAISLQPELAVAHAMLSTTLREREDFQGALQEAELALAISPKNAAFLLQRAQALNALGRTADAEADLQQALAVDSGLADGFIALGDRWAGAKRYRLALKYIGTALFIKPGDPTILARKAHILFDSGDKIAALGAYSDAISRAPEMADLYEQRAEVNLALGDLAATLKDYRTFAGLGEDAEEKAYSSRDAGDKLLDAGYQTEAFEIYGDALKYFEAYIDLPPQNGWNFYVRGQIFENIGRIDDAIGEYGRAIDLDPSMDSFRKARGALLLSEKDAPEVALEDYRALIAMDPTRASYHVEASRALANMGDSEAAVEEATKAIELDPSYARAYRFRGDAYADLGRVDVAIADYSKAIELDPEYNIALRGRGDIYRKVEQYEAAVADYTRAIEIDPDYESAIIGRAYALMSLGRFEEAEKDLTRELELDPEYSPALFARGRAYRHLKKPDLAVIDLARASAAGEIYALLFLYLTEWPQDEARALANLSEAASAWGSQDWPRPIVDYFLGVLSSEALSAAASNAGEQCEVSVYVTSDLLLRQETEEAINLLRKAVEICPHDYIEYDEAQAELAVLAPPASGSVDDLEILAFHRDFAEMAAHGVDFGNPEIVCTIPVDLPSGKKGNSAIALLADKGEGAQVWALVDFPLTSLRSLWTGGTLSDDPANPRTAEWGWMYDLNGDGVIDWVAYINGSLPVLPKGGLPDGFPNLSAGEVNTTVDQISFLYENVQVTYRHILDADFDQEPDRVIELPVSEENGWLDGAMILSVAGAEGFSCTWQSSHNPDDKRSCVPEDGSFMTLGDAPVRRAEPPIETLALYWLAVRTAASSCDFGPLGIERSP